MVDNEELFNGLQQFREYVEANFPFKATVYFGAANPSVTGFLGNLGDLYFLTDSNSQPTQILNIYYKANLGDTDWALFGNGGSTPTTSTSVNTAGISVQTVGISPFGLQLTLQNYNGSTITFENPLTLPFRNSVNTTTSGIYSLVNFTQPISLTLNSSNDLGIESGTTGQIFVYLGINVNDPTNRILAVKGNTRIPGDSPVTVYDFDVGDSVTNRVYTSFANPADTGLYNLRLISVIDVAFSNVTGWSTPILVSAYSPELDDISSKLLSSSDAGIPLRQQLNVLAKPDVTLKDFQQLYNNLCEQTYVEKNNINVFSMSVNTALSQSIFLQNYAISVNPLNSNLELTIPSIGTQRTLYITNRSASNAFTIVYDNESLVINPDETRQLNFCGTNLATSPKIRQLDNKVTKDIPNYFGVFGEVDFDNSLVVITLKHPNGTDLSQSNYVDIDLNISETPSSVLSSTIRKYRVTTNQIISIPFDASLGLELSSSTPQKIFIYMFSDGTLQGLAVSGLGRLLEDKLYNILPLNIGSTAPNSLYSNTPTNNVAIKCVGFLNYVNNATYFTGVSLNPYSPNNSVLTDFYNPPFAQPYVQVTSNDNIQTALEKLQAQSVWLNYYTNSLSKVQNIGLLEPYFNSTTSEWSIELSETYDANGIAQDFGKRYCILDFATPTAVEILATSGAFVVFEIVDASVTLSIADGNDVVLAGPNKKYFVWVARPEDFSGAEERIRIISEYPIEIPPSNIKNFKTLNIPTGSYTALVNDALVLSNPSNAFQITLPVTTTVGDSVLMYFSNEGVIGNYSFNYTVLHSVGTPFYQTVDSNIVVSNGGLYLKFEYVILNNNPYWFVSSGDYNIQETIV